MAVKVIGQSKEVAKKCICRGCGAILTYHQNDIKSYHGRDISGGPDGQDWINCPQCNKEVILRSW